MGPGPSSLDEERAALAQALPAYDLEAVLGRGAFAVVYAATHVRLGRVVAIKRLAPELVRDLDARERFAVEARLLASLDHPHVVRVYDYVESETVCALVMERLGGETLGERARVSAFPPASACVVALAVLYGLEHAHQHGVLHRDVKPDNILFGEGDLVKVADFGIAKVIGAKGARLTATATALGTPAFMAPEQVSRLMGPISPATDVWAVGAVLYELLAGEPPFALGEHFGEALHQRLSEDARPLGAVAPHLDEELTGVVMRALERDPARRHHTAGAFASALEGAAERACGPGALEATGMPLHPTGPQAVGSSAPTFTGRDPRGGRPRPPSDGTHTATDRLRRVPARGLAAASVAILAGVGILLGLIGGGGAGRASAIPNPPPGWPSVMSIGWTDQVAGSAGVAHRGGPGASTQGFFAGDAAAGKDWSHDPTASPARFANDAWRHGLFPYAVYYQLRAIGQTGHADAVAPGIRKSLVDRRLMRIYWTNVRRFLESLGSVQRPVAVSVESGVWALLEQQLGFNGARADSVPALVDGSGMPELRGLPDDLPGFAKAWVRLRDRYAPKVLLGYELDAYGANVELRNGPPPRTTVIAGAQQAAVWYELLFAGRGFDFAGFSTELSAEQGQDPRSPNVYSPAQRNAAIDFVREFVRVGRLPVVIEGVPLGNSVMKTIDDRPYHWRDSWVQWLLGADSFSNLRLLRDAGVIGIQFGVSSGPNETCPCDAAHDGITNQGARGFVATSADDDGGYFAARLAALRSAGGLRLG